MALCLSVVAFGVFNHVPCAWDWEAVGIWLSEVSVHRCSCFDGCTSCLQVVGSADSSQYLFCLLYPLLASLLLVAVSVFELQNFPLRLCGCVPLTSLFRLLFVSLSASPIDLAPPSPSAFKLSFQAPPMYTTPSTFECICLPHRRPLLDRLVSTIVCCACLPLFLSVCPPACLISVSTSSSFFGPTSQ